jgi:hypothetical protein
MYERAFRHDVQLGFRINSTTLPRAERADVLDIRFAATRLRGFAIFFVADFFTAAFLGMGLFLSCDRVCGPVARQ